MNNFDILKKAAGPLRAVSETLGNLQPNKQGKLILTFEPVVDYPTVSAIEVFDQQGSD